ncbi:MAG: PAS domain S-box protein [Chloroflexi bacterium]|nr:PAS domain S-box protein [Chloroflexota bacterium]
MPENIRKRQPRRAAPAKNPENTDSAAAFSAPARAPKAGQKPADTGGSWNHYLELAGYPPEGAVTVDKDNRIIEIDPVAAEMLGAERTGLEGKRLTQFIALESQDSFYAHYLGLVRSGSADSEVRMLRANGTAFQARLRSLRVTRDEEPSRFRVRISDITDYKRVRETARELGRRVRRLFESDVIGIIVTEQNGRILESNDAFLKMVGYEREDLARGRMSWRDMTPPEYTVLVEKAQDQLFTGGSFGTYEKEFFRRDGSRVPVLVGGTLWESSTANPTAVCFVLDISERKRAEASLETQASLFEAVLRQSQDGVVISGADGRLLFVNAAARRMLLTDPEGTTLEIPRSVWGEAYDTKGNYIPPRDWSSRRALRGEVTQREAMMVRPDGSSYYILVRGAPLRRPDGAISGSVVTFSDITERKQSETHREELLLRVDRLARELAEDNDVLNVIMSHTQFQLVYFDRDFNFVKVNPAYARSCGYNEAELVGRNHFALFPNAENQAIFAKVRDTGVAVEFHDKPFQAPGAPESGVTYWDWTLSPVRDAGGKVTGLVLSMIETTQRKLAEEKHKQSQKLAAIGELSGNISHELRNPLATIDSSVFYLKSRLAGAEPKIITHLDRIKSSVSRCTGIIQSLLNLTRMKEPRISRLDLKEVVLSTLARSDIPQGVEVAKNLVPAKIDGDAEQLQIAFRNILLNAVQAMEGGGTLTVELDRNCCNVRLSFSDTGPGIPPENMPHLFQPLFTTKAQGIGFGLSIARAVIEKHGGRIEAHAVAPHGARIEISLPMPS